jgi:hypothetical protein
MNKFSNSVLAYYIAHFGELNEVNQFHFVSRLYLWNQDPWAKEQIDRLKPYFTCNNDPEKALIEVFKYEPGIENINALEARRPYFEKYSDLRGFNRVFFKANFLNSIYGIDIDEFIAKNFDVNAMGILAKNLLNDPKAITILSTHAVNYLYFYKLFIKHDYSQFEPSYFIDMANKYYDDGLKQDLQLKIYLYTHCIIGEANFYCRSVNANAYLKILSELEIIIERNFKDINLDNKFEFIVCARILGQKSRLAERIYGEAERSVSSNGGFVIDVHNSNPQVSRSDINRSEHRNILLIMSSEEYKPLV